jgi:hypothetical protein
MESALMSYACNYSNAVNNSNNNETVQLTDVTVSTHYKIQTKCPLSPQALPPLKEPCSGIKADVESEVQES